MNALSPIVGVGSLDTRANRATWPARRIALFASLFWLLTFTGFSIGASLGAVSDYRFWDPSRIAATVIGALFFASVMHTLAHRECGSLAGEARLVLSRAAMAIATIGVVRLLIDLQINPSTPTLDLVLPLTARWLIIWIVYFFGWSAFYLVLRYHNALAEQRRQLLVIAQTPPESAALPRADEAEEDPLDALWAERNRQRVRVPLDCIEWVEAEGDYVRLHAGDTGGTIRMTLSHAEKVLARQGFLRVHRSVLCRRDSIVAVSRTPTGAMRAVLAGGDTIPVGRSFASIVSEMARPPAG